MKRIGKGYGHAIGADEARERMRAQILSSARAIITFEISQHQIPFAHLQSAARPIA